MSIIDLDAVRRERSPHIAGPARCTACAHEWVAVTPAGTLWLECPSCHTERGLLRFHVRPGVGLSCGACGCDAWAIALTGVLCMGCGKPATV